MKYYLDDESIFALKFLFVSDFKENIAISHTDGKSFFTTMIPATEEGIDDRFYFPLDDAFGYYVQNHSFRYFDYHRRNNNLFSFRNIVVDIDKDNHSDYSSSDDYDKRVLAFVIEKELDPTMIVVTGGGLQIWFHIDEKSIFLKDYVLEATHDAFNMVSKVISGSGYSVDNRTNQISKLYRLPGSIHQKRKVKNYIFCFKEKTFKLSDFHISGYLACETVSKKEKVKREKPFKKSVDFDSDLVIDIGNYSNLHNYRIRFIEKAIDLGYIVEGHREYALWIYNNSCNWLGKVSDIDRLNLKLGLPDAAISAIKKETKLYKFKQRYFFDFDILGLSEEQIVEVNKLVKKHFKDKNDKAIKKNIRNDNIIKMRESGASIREICSVLGVSSKTVSKVLNS